MGALRFYAGRPFYLVGCRLFEGGFPAPGAASSLRLYVI